MLVIRAGINKMLVKIANREYPDQTAVSLGFFGMQLVSKLLNITLRGICLISIAVLFSYGIEFIYQMMCYNAMY